MPATISEIVKNSIAEELCFEKGDKILSINGETPKDLIDYRFAINDEYIELELERKNGEIEVYEIEKILMRIWALFLSQRFLTG